MTHQHTHTLSTMSSDRIRTLETRERLIEDFVMRSPVWHMDSVLCHLALELIDHEYLKEKVGSEPIRFSRMLLEVRLFTLGEVIGPKEMHVTTAEWTGDEGEQNALMLSVTEWTDAFTTFVAGMGFHGTLFFEGEVVGRGILCDTSTGLRLERCKRLKTWPGVRKGTLRWVPDPGPQADMPRRMSQVEVIGEIDPDDPVAMASAAAIVPRDPRLN